MMTESETNVQAYRTMAEVLVSYRKIFLRGLHKLSGDTWYLDACPPGVYERLVDRKETELAVERLSFEYEDLMSFATFGDLAEIVDFNEDLARLLKNLASSREELCARLEELESLRIKLAMACSLDEHEILALTARREELQQILAGARKRAKSRAEGEGPAMPEAAPAPAVAVEAAETPEELAPLEEETAEPIEEVSEAEEVEAAAEVTAAPVVAEAAAPVDEAVAAKPRIELDDDDQEVEEEALEEVEAGEVTEAEPAAEPEGPPPEVEPPDSEAISEDLPPPVEPVQPPDDEPAEMGEAELDEEAEADEILQDIPAAEVRETPAAPLITVEPEAMAADMERALTAGDAKEVLRLLRREIVAVAEAVYRFDEDIQTKGWELAWNAGWVEEQPKELGLESLLEFHDVVSEYREALEGGSSKDELRDHLSKKEFPQLLLTLREVFIQNEL
jgi:hypothetical protein